MSWKVLVVEDESDMLDMAQLWLGNEGHRVIRCASGSEELLREVWKHKNLPDASDMKSKVDTRLVNVHIQRLRAKIEENPDDPQIVTTVRGRGYKAGAF